MCLSHGNRVRYLYKAILRLHRGMPLELQQLGNGYVKDEFKRHKGCNPSEATVFMTEWTKYAIDLTKQLGLRGRPKDKIGQTLDLEMMSYLNDDQVYQLYELMQAAKGNDPENPATSVQNNSK